MSVVFRETLFMSDAPSFSYLMSLPVLKQIYLTIGSSPAEHGGILGVLDGVIRRFYYDAEGACSERSYYPDIKRLNEIIEEWGKEGVTFCGIIHSHHPSAGILSSRDIEFGRAILKDNPGLKSVFFPLVFSTAEDTVFRIIPYVIDANSVFTASVKISNRI